MGPVGCKELKKLQNGMGVAGTYARCTAEARLQQHTIPCGMRRCYRGVIKAALDPLSLVNPQLDISLGVPNWLFASK